MKTTILSLVLAAVISVPTFGKTITVDLKGGADFKDIQEATRKLAGGSSRWRCSKQTAPTALR